MNLPPIRSLAAGREVIPRSKKALGDWIRLYTGVRLADTCVCEGHTSQLDVMWHLWDKQPPESLLLGGRGSGKSFISGIRSHLRSRFFPNHGTRVLGGAKSQAQQVQNALKEAILSGGTTLKLGQGQEVELNDRDVLLKPGVEFITYRNGSEIRILTASPTSVRGPHVPDLDLDEVDEIEPDLRESAYGMVMYKGRNRDVKPTIVMTSTWHNVAGPMQDLIDKAREKNEEKPGSYPFFTFCLFDVLERCPERISGPPKPPSGDGFAYEDCHVCPLRAYCYADADRHGGQPKAKRSNGHYTIESAVQKMGLSRRIFEADYLCMGPRAEGIWFSGFSDKNVSAEAEYDPAYPVEFSLDTGLHTGGVFFQVRKRWVAGRQDWLITVFGDYFEVDQIPEVHVNAIKAKAASLCNGRIDKRWTDPAGKQRNAIGSVALGEYSLAGMTFTCWPSQAPKDGLTMMEGLVQDAAGEVRLLIHPRCQKLITAFRTYRRSEIKGSFQDIPMDPQHPSEDLMDALRGGLIGNFPEGRLPQPNLQRVDARRII